MPTQFNIGDMIEYPVQWPGFTQNRKGMIASEKFPLMNRFGEEKMAYKILTEDTNQIIQVFEFNIFK